MSYKLKTLTSIMLAAVLSVSLLTGCSTGEQQNNSSIAASDVNSSE